MNICQFCNKEFSKKCNLDTHIKTAQYCLKLRGTTEEHGFRCKYCSTVFSTNQRHDKHIIDCKNKEVFEKHEQDIKKYRQNIKIYKQIIEEHLQDIEAYEYLLLEYQQNYDELANEWEKYFDVKMEGKNQKIAKLEKQLEIQRAENIKLIKESSCAKGEIKAYKSRPQKIINNTLINGNVNNRLKILPLNQIKPMLVRAKEIMDDYTYDLYLAGVNGLLSFIINVATLEVQDENGELITEKSLVCTDSARTNFYLLEDENLKKWVFDSERKGINQTLDLIRDKVEEYNYNVENSFIRLPRKTLEDSLDQYHKKKKLQKERKVAKAKHKAKCKKEGLLYFSEESESNDNSEEERILKQQEIDDINMSKWGGISAEEAYENFDRISKNLSVIYKGVMSEYNKGSDREMLVNSIITVVKHKLHI